MIESEDAFIGQINSKDVLAFKRLFAEFYGTLVLFAMGFVKQQDVAEDIVQELFLSVWQQNEAYSSFLGFKTFLYRSVRNRSLNHLKRKSVEERYLSTLTFDSGFVDADNDLDDKIMKEELYRMLIEAVNELPKRCREVFELHMKGRKNEEIAETLKLSILTVKTQKKRAVRFLKERLGSTSLTLCLLYGFFK